MKRSGTAPRASIIAIAAVVAALALIAILAGGLRGPAARPTGTGGAPNATGSGSDSAGGSAAPAPGTQAGTPAAPATGAPAILVGAGDIAVCGSERDSETAALLDEIGGTVFTLGDNAYENGSRREFEECYAPTWGRHRDRTRPAPGNHEYNTAGAAGYFDYFGVRAGDAGKGYYAYDLGAWRVYSLNSNCAFVACDGSSAQLAWLRADLAANPRECTLAYWHAPRYSSGRHGNDSSTDALWDALFEAGAELVLAGHDHTYERFAPMNAEGDADPERGLVSFVVGTGGRSLYEFHDIQPASEVRDATTWGVLELTLSPGSWTSRFVPVAGSSFTDAAAGTCH